MYCGTNTESEFSVWEGLADRNPPDLPAQGPWLSPELPCVWVMGTHLGNINLLNEFLRITVSPAFKGTVAGCLPYPYELAPREGSRGTLRAPG